MLAELARFAAGWPLALSLAAVLTGQGLLAGRRRVALNEALHELRRPLQALVLALPADAGRGGAELSRQAAAALERLQREINGEGAEREREPVALAPLLAAAVARWAGLAARAGSRLSLRPGGEGVSVRGDRGELERAVDNLVVNALEHGGARVSVGVEASGAPGSPASARIVVLDSGPAPKRGAFVHLSRTDAPGGVAGAVARLSGRRRRGHGLRVVRRVAAAHGGDLRLRLRRGRTEAVLELPLAEAGERA